MVHHWDFFGPDAHKTSEHFKKHLLEFAQNNHFAIRTSGFFAAEPHHTCFWVEFDTEEASQTAQKRLRPRRSLTQLEHENLLTQIIQEH